MTWVHALETARKWSRWTGQRYWVRGYQTASGRWIYYIGAVDR